jgi:hypothetical protein
VLRSWCDRFSSDFEQYGIGRVVNGKRLFLSSGVLARFQRAATRGGGGMSKKMIPAMVNRNSSRRCAGDAAAVRYHQLWAELSQVPTDTLCVCRDRLETVPYYRYFHHYPSQILTPSTVIQRVTRDVTLVTMVLATLGSDLLFHDQLDVQVIRALLAAAPASEASMTVNDLLSGAAVSCDRRTAMRHLMWTIKYGFFILPDSQWA